MLAAEMVRQSVNVIFAANGPAAVAAKAATTNIPIVFQAGFDPVAVGLVSSLNRPGGNVTGVTTQGLELGPKRLEMLRDLVPGTGEVAALVNNSNALNVETNTRALQTAADALNLKLQILHASAPEDFDRVFVTLAKLRPIGLVIAGDQFFTIRIDQLGALSAQHRVPTIFQYREFAVAGGLMSYGTSTTDSYRLAAVLTFNDRGTWFLFRAVVGSGALGRFSGRHGLRREHVPWLELFPVVTGFAHVLSVPVRKLRPEARPHRASQSFPSMIISWCSFPEQFEQNQSSRRNARARSRSNGPEG